MKSIYYAVKVKINSWMDVIIRFSNIQRTKAAPISNTYFRNLVFGIFSFIGNAASLVQQFPRMEVFEIQHAYGKFIFLGFGKGEILIFMRHFDQSISDVSPNYIGKWNLFSLPKLVDHYLNNGYDMVVFQVSPLYPFRFRARYQLLSQVVVEQVAYLPDSVETLLKGGNYREMRRLLNRAQREGITYRFSQQKKDFDLFYYQMYKPYVQDRHGIFVEVISYELLWKEFQQGGLLMIYKEDQEIAASLVQSFGDFGIGFAGGVLETRSDFIPKKIFPLLVLFSLDWAINNGIKRFNMGNSYAYRNNGVFRFKNSFRPVVESQYRFNLPIRMILMNQPTKDLEQALNTAGLILRHNTNLYGVMLTDLVDGHDETFYRDALEKASNDGLAGLAIVAPNQQKFIRSIQL